MSSRQLHTHVTLNQRKVGILD